MYNKRTNRIHNFNVATVGAIFTLNYLKHVAAICSLLHYICGLMDCIVLLNYVFQKHSRDATP